VFPADSLLYDNELTVDHQSATGACEFGMSFEPGYDAVLDEAKVFINFLTDKTPYVDHLHFEGSLDNFVTSTRLHTFGEEVHTGWNYIEFSGGGRPVFSSYRFLGDLSGSCRVTEFRLTGVQAVSNTEPVCECAVSLKIDGSPDITLEAVNYSNELTAKLDSISPRFGSVLGNTLVTLTGTNFAGSLQQT